MDKFIFKIIEILFYTLTVLIGAVLIIGVIAFILTLTLGPMALFAYGIIEACKILVGG